MNKFIVLMNEARSATSVAGYFRGKFGIPVAMADMMVVYDRETYEERIPSTLKGAEWMEIGEGDAWTRLKLRERFGESITDKAIRNFLQQVYPPQG